ncbi:uncharacterized protein M6B38_385640 [Iris pallida]|uniref:Uncharacterized protein n=1 Tax=Iris pallida TaxID=29817 RepID=A0AAX6G2D2_IRIPA|nr:uncharacterized protein M6B38_385640 [Iris pallida]
MAASTKFDFPSSFSDGSAHPNAQRGIQAVASLERPGSFREANESRILSSLPNTTRTGSLSSQADGISLLQTLVSDLKPVVFDQKLPRPGEMRRSISSILGTPAEDSLPATFSIKPLPSSSTEEIKRLRSNLREGSVKARDRAKAFGEAALKMDKFYNNLPRKRSRNDNSSMERSHPTLPAGNVSKMSPQSHLAASSLELGHLKSEERAKSAVPNRRMRTSLVELRMDARVNSSARQSGPTDKDRDMLKLVNGGATPSEEKVRGLPTVADGWEKSKMKKKRSAIKPDASGSAVLARSHDSDCEPKRGMQQKLATDARPRLTNTHGFRSGPATGVSGVGKFDSDSQPNAVGSRPFSRNDPDNGSLPNDRRDRIVGCDKESAILKAASKSNGREDNLAVSPTSVMKINTSVRGPRSNSGSVSKAASPNMNRVLGNSDDWELPQCMNKPNGSVGVVNRKRSASVRSLSPPVGQWGGQRPQKITRIARRSNLPPVVSSREDYTMSERHDSAAVNDDGIGFPRRSSTSASLQSKSKCDQVLSESEESGVVENKLKDKSKKCNETEDKSGSPVQKVTTLVPPRKNKVAAEEDLEDNTRRNGKIRRGVSPARSGMPVTIENLDSALSTKQMRSVRIINEKIESKSGRPPTKKWSERKGHTRPTHSMNGGPLDFAGESDDDHEELLAAAKAALDRGKAPAGTFWNDVEEVFGFLSAEDTEFLEKQIRLTEEAAVSTLGAGGTQSLKGLEYNSLPTTPTVSCKDGYGGSSNGFSSLNECARDVEPASQTKNPENSEELVRENGSHIGVSVCQALLSAIIGEDEIENLNHKSYNKEECSYGTYGINAEVDTELNSRSFSFQSSGSFQAAERHALSSYKANSGWVYNDEHAFEDLGSNGMVDELLPNLAMTGSTRCNDYEYNQMSINDRILLELSEIGLYPEPVPHLEQSEDEDISEAISRLTGELHEQVTEKKRLLLKLEKAVKEARESQQRELESTALDKLVEAAYGKYMACWGPNSSGNKNMARTNKQATTQAFIKRTLARCREFEKTKVSCFSEPTFRDMFLSVSSHKGDARNIDLSATAVAAHLSAPSRHPDTPLTDQNLGLVSESVQVDAHETYPDVTRSANQLTDQICGTEDPWSTKLKKKELLLDDVVGSALRAHSGLGSSLVSGTKGKRSEREREGKGQNRDAASRVGTAKVGRSAVSNVKVDKKNKSKPKQKTTQLSASVNGLIGKAIENKITPSAPKSREIVGGSTRKDEFGVLSSCAGAQNLSNDAEAMDLCTLQLPEIDVSDFGAQGQDIASWLNIEDDGLQDHDYMGLQIPMDDLSDVLT